MNEYKLFDEPKPKKPSKVKEWFYLFLAIILGSFIGNVLGHYAITSQILETWLK